MEKAKYHHLIPQTYLSSWANEHGSLQIEYINDIGRLQIRNKSNIAGINDYYSIRAGMASCSKKDAEIIFASLSDYTVICGGEVITNPLKMNELFWRFDEWEIFRKDGTIVSKKKLKHEIEQIKIKDIETEWNRQYEYKWQDVLTKIQTEVLHTTSNTVPSFEKNYLMLFFTALNWRGFRSNDHFEDFYSKLTSGLLSDILIPESERLLPMIKTAKDEIKHDYLIKTYRKFLNYDGVMYKQALIFLERANFHFLIADKNSQFITCDSPAFEIVRHDGYKEGIMPISPSILLTIGKCTNDQNKYYISRINEKGVSYYNKIIKLHAYEFSVIPYNDN